MTGGRKTRKSFKTKKPTEVIAEVVGPPVGADGEITDEGKNVSLVIDQKGTVQAVDDMPTTATPQTACRNCGGNGESECPVCSTPKAVKVDPPRDAEVVIVKDDTSLNRFQLALVGPIHHLENFDGSIDQNSEAQGGLFVLREAQNRLAGCKTGLEARAVAKRLQADCLAKPHGNVFTQQGVRRACGVVRTVLDRIKE